MHGISRTYAHDALFWVALALVAAVVADLYVSASDHKRTFTVLAMEPRGTVSSDKGPFPGQAPTMVAKTNAGEWRPAQGTTSAVGTYVWYPNRIVVEVG